MTHTTTLRHPDGALTWTVDIERVPGGVLLSVSFGDDPDGEYQTDVAFIPAGLIAAIGRALIEEGG